MIKRTVLALVSVVSMVAAAYVLLMLDQIVHGTLYNWGLQFNYAWANPYWFLLRVIQVLLAINIIATVVSEVFTLRGSLKAREPRVKTVSSSRVAKQVPVASSRNGVKPRSVSSAPQASQSSPSSSSAVSFPRPRLVEQSDPSPSPVMPQVSVAPAPASTPVQSPSMSSSLKSSRSSGLVSCSNCGKSFAQPLRMLDFQGEGARIVDTCPFCGHTISDAGRSQESRDQDLDGRFLGAKVNHDRQRTATQ